MHHIYIINKQGETFFCNMDNKNDGKKQGGKMKFNILWMYFFIFAVLASIFVATDTPNGSFKREVSYTEFQSYVNARGVKSMVVIDKTEVQAELGDSLAKKLYPEYEPNKSKKAYVIANIPSADRFANEVDAWNASGVFKGDVKYENGNNNWGHLFWSYGPLVLLIVFWIWMMRRMSSGGSGGSGGIFNVGKSKAKLFDKENSPGVTFKDVAGLAEAKTEVAEIVDFLKNPQTYTNLGGKIPKGALLVGPPGTGKTLLAKAVAGEANVPFFSLSGSDFVEMFVGVGASRVRDLFRQAKEKSPCIVFIDEIDAVGRARGRNASMNSNDERENTLNQLLTEMDGFGTNSGVIILAATNRADILDKALLRAGRFDRQIYVELPDLNDRKEVFQVHLRNVKIDDSVDVDLLARQTPGFSGADIANVCNEAAILAARQNREAVTMADFNEAIDKVTLGLENKSLLMTRQDVYETAVHEAGHTTTIWLLEHAAPLVKISIVPRGKALGVNLTMPEERVGYTKQAFLDEICSFMGGRAAEELFLGTIGTGALNDMQQATRIARSMVMYYGMSEKMPNISYYDPQGQLGQRPYSDERARLIDEETSRIVNEQYERAKKLISEHAEQHHKVVDALMEKEVIFAADVEAIFGKRPWKSRTEQLMEVAEARRKSQQ